MGSDGYRRILTSLGVEPTLMGFPGSTRWTVIVVVMTVVDIVVTVNTRAAA